MYFLNTYFSNQVKTATKIVEDEITSQKSGIVWEEIYVEIYTPALFFLRNPQIGRNRNWNWIQIRAVFWIFLKRERVSECVCGREIEIYR